MKFSDKRCLKLFLLFAVVLMVFVETRELQRYDLRCELAEKLTPYLEDVDVQVIGKCDDVYYFLVDSTNIGELTTEELKALYDEVDLEKINVIFTSEGKQYYLLPEGERIQVKYFSQK